ncbi:MAG: RdgB/HAM1 family non-canonical purine NTP pyrophosphatase [Candidatus Korobacteraceae bacterium]
MLRIFVATTNKGKLRDFAGAVAGSDVELMPLPKMESLSAPAEDGDTFEANARKKAEYYSRLVPGEWVLADDSGLEVEALGGAPGVHSARYAAMERREGGREDASSLDRAHPASSTANHSNSSDEENNARLLHELERVPEEWRNARFVCVLAAARDGKTLLTARGEVEGVILRQRRGSQGFGYDPLFFLPELGKTAAELSAEEKAKVSHRGRALRSFLQKWNAALRSR